MQKRKWYEDKGTDWSGIYKPSGLVFFVFCSNKVPPKWVATY
jgi:hypothetical protein